MKGKKFTAAEKHFEKRRLDYEKKIAALKTSLDESNKERSCYMEKASALEAENETLRNWVERLLEYTELAKDDIRIACEKDKNIALAVGMMESFGLFR